MNSTNPLPLTVDVRNKMKLNLLNKLGPNTKSSLDNEQIEELELSIYNYVTTNSPVKNHAYAYMNQAKMIYLHLAPESYINNDYLLKAVKSNILNIKDLGFMNECDMNPAKWQGSMSKIAEAKQVSHGAQVVASDIIKCRCGGQTTFTEQQTRSSDEAMTIKATCLKCGKKFNI